MNKRSKLLVLLSIFFMAIGFAGVATTLTINGVAGVTNNSEDYEIYFSEAVIDNVSTPSAISANRKTITFNTKVLTDVNQTSTLVYEVTNNSKNYDAEVEIECVDTETGTKYNTGVTNTEYFSFDTRNTPEVVRAQSKKNGSIVVTLTHLSTEIRSYGYRCTMTVNATERDSLVEPTPVILNAGLYDSSDELVASWSELVSDYGLYIDEDFQYDNNNLVYDSHSLKSIIDNNSELQNATKLVVSDTITKIGANALRGLTLTDIVIGSSVETIGDYAISYCDNLEEIIIPDSVQTIGNYAFTNCSNLETFVLNDTVERLETGIFNLCKKLRNITLNNKITYIGDIAFSNCHSLQTFTVPDSVITIGNAVFGGCYSLATLNIGSSVETIGQSAFAACSSLTSIVIPDNVLSVADGLFYMCSNLENVTIGSGLTAVSAGMFSGCTKLKNITIPVGITSIGVQAFMSCSELENVYILNPGTWQIVGGSTIDVSNSSDNAAYLRTYTDWNQIGITVQS